MFVHVYVCMAQVLRGPMWLRASGRRQCSAWAVKGGPRGGAGHSCSCHHLSRFNGLLLLKSSSFFLNENDNYTPSARKPYPADTCSSFTSAQAAASPVRHGCKSMCPDGSSSSLPLTAPRCCCCCYCCCPSLPLVQASTSLHRY